MAKNTRNLNELRDCNLSIIMSRPQVRESCEDKTAQLTCMSLICIIGVVSNILLLYADYREWKKRKTPDKVLICNVSLTNITALLISLPFRAIGLSEAQDVVKCNGIAKSGVNVEISSLIICMLCSVATLGIIGVDRYEALTKFAHQRKLTVKWSAVASCLVWVCSLITVFPSSLTNGKNRTHSTVLISTWISICCAVTVTSLLFAARRIRKHRQQMTNMFGSRRAEAEIKFTKSVIGLCFCYAVFLLPHLTLPYSSSSKRQDPTFKCVQVWATTSAYLSFTVLPVIYFVMDSRMRLLFLPRRAVAPVAIGPTPRGNTRPAPFNTRPAPTNTRPAPTNTRPAPTNQHSASTTEPTLGQHH